MDLIEVLWKQDVDLGVTLAEPATTPTKKSPSENESADEIEKLKALEAINATNQKVRKKNFFIINILHWILRIHLFSEITRLYKFVVSISQSQWLMSNCFSRTRCFLLSRT